MAKSGGKRVPISYHRQMELAKNPGERYGEAFEAKRNRLFTEVNETQGNVLAQLRSSERRQAKMDKALRASRNALAKNLVETRSGHRKRRGVQLGLNEGRRTAVSQANVLHRPGSVQNRDTLAVVDSFIRHQTMHGDSDVYVSEPVYVEREEEEEEDDDEAFFSNLDLSELRTTVDSTAFSPSLNSGGRRQRRMTRSARLAAKAEEEEAAQAAQAAAAAAALEASKRKAPSKEEMARRALKNTAMNEMTPELAALRRAVLASHVALRWRAFVQKKRIWREIRFRSKFLIEASQAQAQAQAREEEQEKARDAAIVAADKDADVVTRLFMPGTPGKTPKKSALAGGAADGDGDGPSTARARRVRMEDEARQVMEEDEEDLFGAFRPREKRSHFPQLQLRPQTSPRLPRTDVMGKMALLPESVSSEIEKDKERLRREEESLLFQRGGGLQLTSDGQIPLPNNTHPNNPYRLKVHEQVMQSPRVKELTSKLDATMRSPRSASSSRPSSARPHSASRPIDYDDPTTKDAFAAAQPRRKRGSGKRAAAKSPRKPDGPPLDLSRLRAPAGRRTAVADSADGSPRNGTSTAAAAAAATAAAAAREEHSVSFADDAAADGSPEAMRRRRQQAYDTALKSVDEMSMSDAKFGGSSKTQQLFE